MWGMALPKDTAPIGLCIIAGLSESQSVITRDGLSRAIYLNFIAGDGMRKVVRRKSDES